MRVFCDCGEEMRDYRGIAVECSNCGKIIELINRVMWERKTEGEDHTTIGIRDATLAQVER